MKEQALKENSIRNFLTKVESNVNLNWSNVLSKIWEDNGHNYCEVLAEGNFVVQSATTIVKLHDSQNVQTLFKNTEQFSLKPHDFVAYGEKILLLIHDQKNGKDHIICACDLVTLNSNPEILHFSVVERSIYIMYSSLSMYRT